MTREIHPLQNKQDFQIQEYLSQVWINGYLTKTWNFMLVFVAYALLICLNLCIALPHSKKPSSKFCFVQTLNNEAANPKCKQKKL